MTKHFRILQNIFISNKYCSFELSINQNPGKNESWFSTNISEGLCDTEDWSNDADSALPTGINDIWQYIQIENSYLNSKL